MKHLIWILLAGLVVAGASFLGYKRWFADAPAAGTAQENDPRAQLATRLRGRSVPHFQTTLQPEDLKPPPLPPPVFVEPPPPTPAAAPAPQTQSELRQKASKDGYLFQEAGSSLMYVVKGGTKYVVKTQEELRALGYQPGQVEVVAPGALDFLSSRPAERTLLRERDKAPIFYYENGQKHWIQSAETFNKLGYKGSDVKILPSGSLDSEASAAPIP